LTSKTHALVDGKGRLLACIISPGQTGDSPVLPALLAELRVNCHRPGQPRTTPISVRGDKAYSSRGHRTLLRSRGIRAVIPEPADQVANRLRRGAAGGRPVSYDAEDYKPRKRRRTVLQPHEELARPGTP
jgi:transposase